MLVVSTASAETLPERAQRLFQEGLSLKDQGDPRACDRFAESYRLVAAAGTGFNLAECMEQQGQLLRAWQLYGEAIVEWQRDDKDKRAAIARERVRNLEPKLVTIVIEIDDPKLDKLSVTIGKRVIEPKRTIRERADPGQIEVRAVAPGHLPFVRTLEATAGATRKLRIALDPIATLATDAPPPLVETHRRKSRVAWAIGLGVVGTAGFVTGTVLFFDARQLQADGETDRARDKADVATALGIGGAILVGAGAVVFATAPHDVTVMPVATPSTVGLSFAGSF